MEGSPDNEEVFFDNGNVEEVVVVDRRNSVVQFTKKSSVETSPVIEKQPSTNIQNCNRDFENTAIKKLNIACNDQKHMECSPVRRVDSNGIEDHLSLMEVKDKSDESPPDAKNHELRFDDCRFEDLLDANKKELKFDDFHFEMHEKKNNSVVKMDVGLEKERKFDLDKCKSLGADSTSFDSCGTILNDQREATNKGFERFPSSGENCSDNEKVIEINDRSALTLADCSKEEKEQASMTQLSEDNLLEVSKEDCSEILSKEEDNNDKNSLNQIEPVDLVGFEEKNVQNIHMECVERGSFEEENRDSDYFGKNLSDEGMLENVVDELKGQGSEAKYLELQAYGNTDADVRECLKEDQQEKCFEISEHDCLKEESEIANGKKDVDQSEIYSLKQGEIASNEEGLEKHAMNESLDRILEIHAKTGSLEHVLVTQTDTGSLEDVLETEPGNSSLKEILDAQASNRSLEDVLVTQTSIGILKSIENHKVDEESSLGNENNAVNGKRALCLAKEEESNVEEISKVTDMIETDIQETTSSIDNEHNNIFLNCETEKGGIECNDLDKVENEGHIDEKLNASGNSKNGLVVLQELAPVAGELENQVVDPTVLEKQHILGHKVSTIDNDLTSNRSSKEIVSPVLEDEVFSCADEKFETESICDKEKNSLMEKRNLVKDKGTIGEGEIEFNWLESVNEQIRRSSETSKVEETSINCSGKDTPASEHHSTASEPKLEDSSSSLGQDPGTSNVKMQVSKEALVDQKIAEIRRKNEQRLKKLKEIEQDKEDAKMHIFMGDESSTKKEVNERRNSDDRFDLKGNGVNGSQVRGRGRGLGRGRARGPLGSDGSRKRQDVGLGKEKLKEILREDQRRKNIQSYKQELERISKHENVQTNVQKTDDEIRREREMAQQDSRKDRHSMNASKLSRGYNMPRTHDKYIHMTGKERQEYDNWKAERAAIEAERVKRHKEAGGKWRREWDKEKEWDSANGQWMTKKGRNAGNEDAHNAPEDEDW